MNKTISVILILACSALSCGVKQESSQQNSQSNQHIQNNNKMVVTQLTKADFLAKVMNYEQNKDKWVFAGNKPCIVDFYADWCGPCKMLAPVMEELAQEYAGQVNFYKVNTETEQELAAAFGIQSIPTILFCPMGENPQMAQGALPKETLKQAINEVLLKK